MGDFPRLGCFSPDFEGIFHRKRLVGLVAALCWGKLRIAHFALDSPRSTLFLCTGQRPYNPCKPAGSCGLKPFRAGSDLNRPPLTSLGNLWRTWGVFRQRWGTTTMESSMQSANQGPFQQGTPSTPSCHSAPGRPLSGALVSLETEMPEVLFDGMRRFLLHHPDWDQYQVITAALACFLFQNGCDHSCVSHHYLDGLFPGT